jgi:8-oxo-dGTP pyrophosphatase MutT (NUDIX family)/GNAT superfamily N-acetyltransferase
MKSRTPSIADDASADELVTIERGLIDHAAAAGVEPRNERPLALVVRDADRTLLGGVAGRTVWGWLHVTQLWVAETQRRRGYGTALLRAAEDEARRRGCRHAYLDTFDFQALPFYTRHGYRPFGTLDGFPSGHARIFLTRDLVAAEKTPDAVQTGAANDNLAYRFPVSVKAAIVRGGRLLVLRNDRGEYELPGGKLEAGESPERCLVREVAEEVDLEVAVADILDSWVYDISAEVRVLIVTYGCVERSARDARLSSEHKELAWLALDEVAGACMPEGYKRSARAWAARLGVG